MIDIATVPEKQVDILVVEDSLTQAQFLARLLLAEGYQVRVAVNGREGLHAARDVRPALIIADVIMPEMDGFAMCKEVRKDPELRETAVILLTSLRGVQDVIKGLDCGADNFIRKPFDSANLIRRVQLILADCEPRTKERLQPGTQVSLGGQTHFITAERRQILDFLISTFEGAVQLTEERREQRAQITHSYQLLKGLYRIAQALSPALTEHAVSKLAVDELLAFPGVLGACIKLLDSDGENRMIAARNYTIDEEIISCDCERQMQHGPSTAPHVVPSCERLARPHVCIPIVTGATRAMLCLLTSPGIFGDHDRHLLATVGSQIAAALERARLYSRMEVQGKERTGVWQYERNLLSAVVDTSGALVCMTDAVGIIRLFNPACERAVGWDAAEAIGQPCWEIFENPNSSEWLRRLFDPPLEQNRPTQLRSALLAKDGGVRKIIWSTTWLKHPDNSVAYFLATGVDVTDLREAEERD